MRITTFGPTVSKVNVKYEQHSDSRAARSRARCCAAASSSTSSRVVVTRVDRTADYSPNNRSNSATRNGLSADGSEHDWGTQSEPSSIAIHRR